MDTLKASFFSLLILFALCSCALPKLNNDKPTSMALNIVRDSAYIFGMKLCNAGNISARVQVDLLPWGYLSQDGLELIEKTKDGEVAVSKNENDSFHDVTPFLFYEVKPGRCLGGKIDLHERFKFNELSSKNEYVLRWKGDVLGDGVRWFVEAEIKF